MSTYSLHAYSTYIHTLSTLSYHACSKKKLPLIAKFPPNYSVTSRIIFPRCTETPLLFQLRMTMDSGKRRRRPSRRCCCRSSPSPRLSADNYPAGDNRPDTPRRTATRRDRRCTRLLDIQGFITFHTIVFTNMVSFPTVCITLIPAISATCIADLVD